MHTVHNGRTFRLTVNQFNSLLTFVWLSFLTNKAITHRPTTLKSISGRASLLCTRLQLCDNIRPHLYSDIACNTVSVTRKFDAQNWYMLIWLLQMMMMKSRAASAAGRLTTDDSEPWPSPWCLAFVILQQ